MNTSTLTNTKLTRRSKGAITMAALGAIALAWPALAIGKPDPAQRCSNTATAADLACRKNAASDFWLSDGMCENLSAPDARSSCIHDAKDQRQDDADDCDAQLEARQALCDQVGQGAYDPVINPANFTTTIDNPFLTWTPGTTFTYENSNGEDVTVVVTSDIVSILGVNCRAVHDTGSVGGDVTEDTFDYYAQDLQGNVWYFGEDTAEYDHGRIISIDGAWRAGEQGAKPGIAQEAVSHVGDIDRQEFQLGNAEDTAEVVSTNADATVPFGGTYHNCLETAETTALEPDGHESKFYASGVGLVLTIDDVSGDREELVNVTTGP